MLRSPWWNNREVRYTVLACMVGLVLIAWEHKCRAAGDISPLARAVRAMVLPLASRISAGEQQVRDTAISTWRAREILEDNHRLQEQVNDLEARLAQRQEMYFQQKQMREDLDWPEGRAPERVKARVIARPVGNQRSKRITIELIGTGEIKNNDVVLQGRGLAGRVIKTDGHIADVMLLTDEDSGVAAHVQRSRHFGVVLGERVLDTPEGLLELRYLAHDADVREGDLIVSSGDGLVYPPGIPIGHVVSVKRDPATDTDKIAVVRPVADFRRLEFVLVEHHR